MSKLIVIGLDGATFDLIKPWAEAGDLPVINRMMKEGISGPLRSTFPPLTGPAWSSFMTGKSPAHHGVFEFFARKVGTYSQVLNNRLSIHGKSIWRFLSDNNQKVAVVGVPLTYPPEELNGICITGLLTPPQANDFTYPHQLLSELENELGKYINRQDEKYRPSNPKLFINEQYEILENNIQAALYLLQNKEWDFFMLHFLGTDRVSHEFWHILDETHPNHDPGEREKLGNPILGFYKAVDEGLGKIIETLDEDTGLIIMSDHGFGSIKKFINLNVWLVENGYLVFKRQFGTWMRYLLYRLGFNYDRLGRIILRIGLGSQAKKLGRAKREELQRKFFLSLDDVDWSRSRAYSMGNFGQIYINLAGREPEGIVESGESYHTLIQELSDHLSNMVDPDSGEKVIERILLRDDVYNGPYLDYAPDLMFQTKDMEYKVMGLSDFSSPRVFEPIFGTTGHHRMDGILIGKWPGRLKTSLWKEGANIEDLAPTILYLMGNPVPESMTGKVLMDFIAPDFTENNPITYLDDFQDGGDKQEKQLTEEEQALLKERLRKLGYVT